jgi:hypothetical protein
LIEKWKNIKGNEKCRNDFLEFVKAMWIGFIMGRHHKILSEKFNRIAQGKLKRLIVCLPPRHSKSEFASTFFPAWMMGLKSIVKNYSSNPHRRTSGTIWSKSSKHY